MRAIAIACALLALTGSSVAGAQEAPAPKAKKANAKKANAKKAKTKKAEEPQTRTYVPLGITGVALFGAGWITTVIVAAAGEVDDRGQAVGHGIIPVLGPFLLLSQGSGPDELEGLVVATGAMQAVGVIAGFLGFTLESKVVPAEEEQVSVRPLLGPVVGLEGSF
jgi:hypothetical protein